MDLTSRAAALEDIATSLDARAQKEARVFAGRFSEELAHYGELVVGRGGSPVGVMVRGEGEGFTRRVAQTLEEAGLAEVGGDYHAFLAEWFEHKRAFFKAEWNRGPDGDLERLAAIYFRRRPRVRDVAKMLRGRGVAPELTERAEAMARLLGKESVHFVAAAFRSKSPAIYHKLYFSQWVTPDTQAAVQGRIERVLSEFGVHASNIQRWSLYHDQLARAAFEPSIFVSLSFTDAEELPWVKIDYPEVSADVAAALLPMGQQPGVAAEGRALAANVGLERLSFVGVRLAHAEGIGVKFYADFPDA